MDISVMMYYSSGMSRLNIWQLVLIPLRCMSDESLRVGTMPGYNTLYSKQETQRCSRSSRRLICCTDKSDTQRSRRAASAFFSTQRKLTSRVLLHSADRELDWRPAWWRQIHKLSGSFLMCFSTKWLFTDSYNRKGQRATYRLRGAVVLHKKTTTWKCVCVERKGRVIVCQTEVAASHTEADLWPVSM